MKKNSLLFIIVTVLEIVFSIYMLIYFNYMDRLIYTKPNIYNNLSLLIQNMYTSTWWALILSFISLISILSLTSIIYKKMEYHFISISLWVLLFILSIDISKSFKYNLSNIMIFLPIIIINILAYKKQKSIISM